MSKIILEEQTSPGTPGTNQLSIYPKAGGLLYSKDDAGDERILCMGAEAWCQADISGGIAASHNVTSVTDGGVGVITYNFTTAFADSNYARLVSLHVTATNIVPNVTNQAAGSVAVLTYTVETPTATDPISHSMACFGKLA